MAYNKNLYSSDVSALDAGIIYDQNQQMMQDEINAAVRDGDIVVGLADNLASEQNQFSTGEFIERTTGGEASLSDGDGYLVLIRGGMIHEGYVAQSVEMEITHASGSEITATIDDDTFLGQMANDSGTFVTTFDGSSWDYAPASYGITVDGTPVEDDTITVIYQKEERGTITQSDPQTFVSTGWNLYNHTDGYARVLKYHETYGFGISGTYTALQFSSTLDGEKSSVTVTDGKFSITEDGYIWVTGGNDTDTAIWMTWSDWQSSANSGTWQAYTESEIDFASVISSYFPYGLMAVGGYQDEIDFSLKKATQNVGRLVYNSTNLETAQSYRTAVDYDEDYIYYGLPTPVVNEIDIPNSYAAYDHGIEFFTNTDVAVYTQTLYGVNLKNKLERDVVTISQQTLSDHQKQQVKNNIGIPFTVNPNLLDNWYFVGGGSQQGGRQFPINSRGQTSYTGNKAYTIDRWYLYDGNVTAYVQNDGLKITKSSGSWYTITQKLENPTQYIGKTLTLSALFEGTATSHFKARIIDENGDTVFTTNLLLSSGLLVGTGVIPSGISELRASFYSTVDATSDVIIKAMKVELGDTQTLAHLEGNTWVLNEHPNYEEQLLRCQTSTADSTDNCAQQLVMTNQTVTNPNLLDNWYFVGGGSQQGTECFPINQRGQTSYGSDIYCIDRWKTDSSDVTVTINSENVNIANTHATSSKGMFQYINSPKNYFGKRVTASCLLSDGSLYYGTGVITSTASTNIDIINNTNFRIRLGITSDSRLSCAIHIKPSINVSIAAVKVELGSKQTLAHQDNGVWVLNEIPKYATELFKCCSSLTSSGSSDPYTNNPYGIISPYNISADLNTHKNGYVEFLKYNGDTLNTPYKEGLLSATAGVALSYYSSANYGMQLAIPAGRNDLYTRLTGNGTTYDWAGLARPSNTNLLDNWFFAGGGSQNGFGIFPINQKRQTSYNNVAAIDRWFLNSYCTVTFNSNYIVLTSNSSNTNRGTFKQRISSGKSAYLRGKLMTASALFSDGTLVSGYGIIPSSAGSSVEFVTKNNFTLKYETRSSGEDEFMAVIPGSGASINLVALKLEFGQIQTLARQYQSALYYLIEIPDFNDMLARCQAYYFRTNFRNDTYNTIGLASADSSSSINIILNTPVTMHKNPSVSMSGSLSFQVGNVSYQASSPSFSIYNASAQGFQIHMTGFSGLTTGSFGFVYGTSNGTLILDANLA